MKQEIQKPLTPSDDQLGAIKTLIARCNREDGTGYEYTGDEDFRRPGEINDFLLVDDGDLVAAGVLFSSREDEAELSAYVRPESRGRGHSKTILQEVDGELRRRGVHSMLIVVDRESVSGKLAARAAGADLEFTEYAMARSPGSAEAPHMPPGLSMREAVRADGPALHRISSEAFGHGGAAVEQILGSETRTAYAIDLQGRVIGMIVVLREKDADYIHGFCIDPAFQGRGYGKAALRAMVHRLSVENPERTMKLDVETANENALGLYRSAGFAVSCAFDYWRRPIQPSPPSSGTASAS